MASKEKSQDEKNLKILRELASLTTNKYCFDCQQRGPTYVNVTIGSFVCTACSGILLLAVTDGDKIFSRIIQSVLKSLRRGLNPPHRVKSITMTSFTAEEMEQIKNRGNEYCKHVWLGKYDSQTASESEVQNVQKVREFMIQKYEEKKWYVDPEIAVKHIKVKVPTFLPNSTVSQSKSQSSIVTRHIPHSSKSSAWPTPVSSGEVTGTMPTDLFQDFGDPFKSAIKTSGTTTESSSFADFSNAFGGSTDLTSAFSSKQILVSSSQFGSFSSTPAFSAPSSAATTILTVSSASKPSMKKHAPPPPDRYAALADLDNQLHHQQQTVPTLSASVVSTVVATTGTPTYWANTNTGFGTVPVVAPSVFATDAQNPFGHTISTWTQQSLISSANPFQAVPQSSVANELDKPTSVSQFDLGNGLPNTNIAAQQGLQNGAVTSTFWQTAANQTWNAQFQNGKMDAFQNKGVTAVDHYNPWAQSMKPAVVNPFMNGSGSSGVPAAVPRTNAGNPFL